MTLDLSAIKEELNMHRLHTGSKQIMVKHEIIESLIAEVERLRSNETFVYSDAEHERLEKELDRLTGIWMEEKNNLNKANAKLAIAVSILKKIEDPRLRDHKEPDKYTELGCVMNMATEALSEIEKV